MRKHVARCIGLTYRDESSCAVTKTACQSSCTPFVLAKSVCCYRRTTAAGVVRLHRSTCPLIALESSTHAARQDSCTHYQPTKPTSSSQRRRPAHHSHSSRCSSQIRRLTPLQPNPNHNTNPRARITAHATDAVRPAFLKAGSDYPISHINHLLSWSLIRVDR